MMVFGGYYWFKKRGQLLKMVYDQLEEQERFIYISIYIYYFHPCTFVFVCGLYRMVLVYDGIIG